MNNIGIILSIIIIYIIGGSYAIADEPEESFSENSLGVLAGISGAFLMSKWASKNPQDFGTVFGLFTPIATHTENGYKDTWPILVSFELVAIYHLNASKNNVPEEEIYQNNLKAWGAVLLVGITHEVFFNDDNIKISYLPTNEGAAINISYNF